MTTDTLPISGVSEAAKGEVLARSVFASCRGRKSSVLGGGYINVVAGTANAGTGSNNLYVNVGTSTRIFRNMPYIDRVKFYIGSLTNVTDLQIIVLRWAHSHMQQVWASGDLTNKCTASSINTITVATNSGPVRVGDYLGMVIANSGGYVARLYRTTATNAINRYTVAAAFTEDLITPSTSSNSDADVTLPIQVYGPAPDLIFTGDSIISGETASANLCSGKADASYTGLDISQSIESTLGINTQNMGVNGNVSAQLVARFTSDIMDMQPKIVVLAIGTNDIEAGYTWASYKANMETMLTLLADNNIPCIVPGIIPRTSWCNPASYAKARARVQWNKDIKALIAASYKNKAFYWDTDSILGENYSDGDVGNLDKIKTAYHVDTIHLNAAGQLAFSNGLLSFIQTNLM